MKKLLLFISSILFVTLSSLGLIACGHTHEYLTEEIIAPTCTEDGYTLHKCECGDEFQDTFIMATGHNFSNYVSNNNATCFSNATETSTCSNENCNEKHTREIANSTLEHLFINYVSNNDATATEDGTETATCSREGCFEQDTRVDVGSCLGSGPDVYTIDFVKNSDCDYQIVVPEDYLATMRLKHIQNGANELKRLIDEATNNTLQIVKDVNYAGGKFISLGDTSLVPATADADLCKLTDDGILLFSQQDNIFLLGGSDTAVHYAVYEFLERYFGYDAIEDVEIIDTNVRNLSIEEFKIIEEPDVLQRHLDGEHAGSLNYKYRMRGGHRGYKGASGLFTYDQNGKPTETYVVRNQHNTLDYIPYNTYKSTHGDYWYATDENGNLLTVSSGGPGEVCFTAHGDADEYEAMTDAYFDIIKQTIIQRFVIAEYQKTGQLWWKNSTWSNMSIGIEDYGITCRCHACTEKTELYGGNRSGLVIKFIKDVADKVYDWFETPEGSNYVIDNFRISFSAYANYADAPAVFDVKENKYVAVHPDVEMNDRIMLNLALSASFKYTAMLDINDPRNAEGKQNILKWFDLTDNITLWTYNANFGEYLHFSDSFSFFSNDTYKFFADLGIISWHNQNAYQCYPITGFTSLKTYLNSKLMWDTDADIDFYINRYFSMLYGNKATQMRNLFNKQRQLYQKAFNDYVTAGDSWNGYSYYAAYTDLCGYYNNTELKQVIHAYDNILSSVEPNSELYYRVLTEAICPYYTLLTNAKTRVASNVTDTNYAPMDYDLIQKKITFKRMIEEHNAYYSAIYGDKGIMYKCETSPAMDDSFWSQLGYRHSPQGARDYSLIIPRLNYDRDRDSGRIANATKKIAIGDHELDWVFGIHSSPYTLNNYQNIKFEVISGTDVIEITPNGYVQSNGGVIPSSLIYDADIKDSQGNKYTFYNPCIDTTKNVSRFDYGILTAKKAGTAIVRTSYLLDGVSYKFDVTFTVN